MKRQEIIRLLHGHLKEIVDGPWNDIKEKLPDKPSCKVKIRLIDGTETFAFFYRDQARIAGRSNHETEPTYFWHCRVDEWYSLKDITHWIHLKEKNENI